VNAPCCVGGENPQLYALLGADPGGRIRGGPAAAAHLTLFSVACVSAVMGVAENFRGGVALERGSAGFYLCC